MSSGQAESVTSRDVSRLRTFLDNNPSFLPEGIRLLVSTSVPLSAVRNALGASRQDINRAAHQCRESLETLSLMNLQGGASLGIGQRDRFRGYRRRPELNYSDPPPEEDTGGLSMATWASVCEGKGPPYRYPRNQHRNTKLIHPHVPIRHDDPP